MAKDDIPVKESTHGGIPVTDVASAQEALIGMMGTPEEEQNPENLEETETTEEVSAQDTESESAKLEEVDEPITGELTTDDLEVDGNPEEEVQEPNKHSINVNGTNLEVTLEDLKTGYVRQADYTRKSQELAEQRKGFEHELQATQQERQRYISQLEQFTQQSDQKLNEFKDIDWAKLQADDPMAYMTKRDQYRDLQENKRLVEEESKTVQLKQQQEQQQKWYEELDRQQSVMAQRLPEWTDPTKGPKLKMAIKTFAVKKGFSDQEVNSLIDARSVDVLHKAMLYENLLEAKISGKKAKVVPKVTKPGIGTNKSDISSEKIKQQRNRLKRSGHINDAKSVIESILKS
tara:strand:- start:54 stop:1094 length:1041 start_codon:yes stop_codon:yes gene_type:complete